MFRLLHPEGKEQAVTHTQEDGIMDDGEALEQQRVAEAMALFDMIAENGDDEITLVQWQQFQQSQLHGHP